MKFLCKLFMYLTGWEINILGNISKKNVVAVVPHTSFWDGIIGFCAMKIMDIKFTTLSAEWLFGVPVLSWVMKHLMHAHPVKNGSISSIRTSIDILKQSDEMSLVICPEGRLKATEKWNSGFYYIAKKAGVPIAVTIFDYKQKIITITECIPDPSKFSADEVMNIIKWCCENYPCEGKYPEKFKFHKIDK